MRELIVWAIVIALGAPYLLWLAARSTGTSWMQAHKFTEDDGSVVEYEYRIKLNHWLPRLTPWHELAITIGDCIFVRGPRCWPALHAHEFRHVVRFSHDGVLAVFYFIRALVTFGYLKSPLELEAVLYASNHTAEFPDVNPFNYDGPVVD